MQSGDAGSNPARCRKVPVAQSGRAPLTPHGEIGKHKSLKNFWLRPSRFKSWCGEYSPVDKLAKSTCLDRVICGFDSHLGY